MKGRGNKYRAIRTEVDGVIFDSKREAHRYLSLKILQKGGKIRDLELQPTYRIEINGVPVCKVKLDFRYWDNEQGMQVVEDSKGVDNAVSKLKRKMVLAQHGVEVRLV
jgi:hypothetical protein